MKMVKYIICGLLAVSVTAVITVFPALADEKNYSIGEAYWEVDSGSNVYAAWDEAESRTAYRVMLYRGTKKVTDWKSASKAKYNFTAAIAKNGNGAYHFDVYSLEGGRDNTLVSSGDLVVGNSDSADISLAEIKKANDARKEESAAYAAPSAEGAKGPGGGTGGAWQIMPDGRWKYYEGESFAVDCWKQIGGVWYHFAPDGYMQTGWTWVRGSDGVSRCYYLEESSASSLPQGGCYMGCTTPDGYTVDADGAWTVSGVVQTQ